MRIVLDTNVLARAALRTSGLGRELLLRCTENPHILVLSEFIVAEVSRVLRIQIDMPVSSVLLRLGHEPSQSLFTSSLA